MFHFWHVWQPIIFRKRRHVPNQGWGRTSKAYKWQGDRFPRRTHCLQLVSDTTGLCVLCLIGELRLFCTHFLRHVRGSKMILKVRNIRRSYWPCSCWPRSCLEMRTAKALLAACQSHCEWMNDAFQYHVLKLWKGKSCCNLCGFYVYCVLLLFMFIGGLFDSSQPVLGDTCKMSDSRWAQTTWTLPLTLLAYEFWFISHTFSPFSVFCLKTTLA